MGTAWGHRLSNPFKIDQNTSCGFKKATFVIILKKSG